MSPALRLVLAAAIAAALASCGYKPLKAPCAADEGGVPSAYSSLQAPRSSQPAPTADGCGPMRPI